MISPEFFGAKEKDLLRAIAAKGLDPWAVRLPAPEDRIAWHKAIVLTVSPDGVIYSPL
jgi:hypothetical protein